MKIVFFGTSENSAILLQGLQTLAESLNIVGVVTAPDAEVGRKRILTPSIVAQTCQNNPTLQKLPILKPTSLKSETFLQNLQSLNADLFVVLSYGKILPQIVIDMPRLGTINVHPSLLPLYRGATPIQSALLNGDTSTANSIIQMDAEMDHGPLLAQEPIEILPNETYEQLETRLAQLSVPLVLKVINDLEAGTAKPEQQNHEIATFVSTITKEHGRVDWSKTAEQIYNQYRAYHRWPGIWTTYQGDPLKILKCSVVVNQIEKGNTAVGTVLEAGAIACGNNTFLQLEQVQLAGKNPIDIKSFLNGRKDFIGTVLN